MRITSFFSTTTAKTSNVDAWPAEKKKKTSATVWLTTLLDDTSRFPITIYRHVSTTRRRTHVLLVRRANPSRPRDKPVAFKTRFPPFVSKFSVCNVIRPGFSSSPYSSDRKTRTPIRVETGHTVITYRHVSCRRRLVFVILCGQNTRAGVVEKVKLGFRSGSVFWRRRRRMSVFYFFFNRVFPRGRREIRARRTRVVFLRVSHTRRVRLSLSFSITRTPRRFRMVFFDPWKSVSVRCDRSNGKKKNICTRTTRSR